MPICGERPKKELGHGFEQDPIHEFAQEFTDTVKHISETYTVDPYTEINKILANNRGACQALKDFFIKESYDPKQYENDPSGLEDHLTMMEAQFENDREAVLEQTFATEINPIIGMTFPLHKNVMMNMVFDKGSIPKFVAQSPSFTIGMEYRILMDPFGNELDLYADQNKLTAAIDSSSPEREIELALPENGTSDIVTGDVETGKGMGGTVQDHLSIATYISAVKISGVVYEAGDTLPDGTVAESQTTQDAWFKVKLEFKPGYGSYQRTLTEPISIECKQEVDGAISVTRVEDVINAIMHDDKFIVNSVFGRVTAVKMKCRLDTSNARVATCSVKWKHKTDLVEIENATPISTTISPEEIKDISALFNVNQVTKIMSMFKTVLANYKDDKIKSKLDESYEMMPESQKHYDTFDYTPRGQYALDPVTWRYAVFMDMFDTYVTKLLQQLNDPNVVITVYGDPDMVRKISPTDYTYQSPSSIGSVELDWTKTVQTSDRRVYNFIGSDKLRNSREFIVILSPKGTDRIMYRIYDYQLYISNEIKNMSNPLLPNLHAFERWKFVQMQPVQGRIGLLNVKGHYGDDADGAIGDDSKTIWRPANEGIFPKA